MISANTEAIIRLAWSRRLGLADDALASGGERVLIERADELSVLQLWDSQVIIGPSELAEQAAGLSEGGVVDAAMLTGLLAESGLHARLSPAELLAYADDYLGNPPDGSAALIAREDAKVAELAALCPPDDVIEVRPEQWQLAFVQVSDDDAHRPLAGAGYAERVGLLGRLATLTAHDERRRGHGRLVAALAMHDALDAGLVVEAGVSEQNAAGRALSRGLGFEEIGRRISAAFC